MRRPGLWGHRDFVWLWSSQTVSQFGSQVSLLALPLVAIVVLGESAFAVAALGVVEFLPFLLFSLPAGVWVDRLPQATTPDRLLGRMNASRRCLVWGVIPLGALAGGGLASTVGLRATLFVGAVGASLAVVPLLFSPVRSLQRVPDADQSSPIASASSAQA